MTNPVDCHDTPCRLVVLTNVSEEVAVAVIRVQQPSKENWLSGPKIGAAPSSKKVNNSLPVDTAYHARRLDSIHPFCLITSDP